MILADTTIVVEFLRTNDAKLRGLIVSSPAAICGVTRAEILHATRDAAHRQTLLTALNMFHQVAFAEPLWDQAGDHLAALRAAGATIPFADVLIATAALSHGLELWTRDRHFADVQRIIPTLRIFQEPP
jgi:predicted nucleic acid-binding protein